MDDLLSRARHHLEGLDALGPEGAWSASRGILRELIAEVTRLRAADIHQVVDLPPGTLSTLIAGDVYVQCIGTTVGPDGRCLVCGATVGNTAGTHMRRLFGG